MTIRRDEGIEADALMTVQDLAAFLQVPVATIYGWNYTGTGPPRIRVGRFVRFRRVDVERWLDRNAKR